MEFLLKSTTEKLYICTLPNVKGEGVPERHILTRDASYVASFMQRWDQPGRGMFYCVSSIRGRTRNKENAAETVMLHADVDFKDISLERDEILSRVLALPSPPSRIHFSGRGFHCLWMLDRAYEAGGEVEVLLKKLASVVGGDPSVAHCAALLRVPGSHNTKNGAWDECQVIRDDSSVFTLEAMEAWLGEQSPVIVRRSKEGENVFTQIADVLSFRAPVDVQQRLANMIPGGDGDRGIHNTQLSVTASMMSSGHEVDEIVETVMAATRAATGDDPSWDWVREERTIRSMCESWSVKLDKKQNEAPAEVVSLAGARSRKAASAELPPEELGKLKKAQVHLVLGTGILKTLQDRGGDLIYSGGQMHVCEGGLWTALTPAEEKSWIDREVEAGCRMLRITSTQKVVNETRAWLQRNPDIHRAKIPWDQHGKIPTLSGLVDLEGNVEEVRPDHYCTYRIDCLYDPQARCEGWLLALADCFRDKDQAERDGTIRTIQEVLGSALLEKKPKSLMRALVLVGPSDSGKSTILNTMAGFISDKANTTPFDTLENAHGLAPFLKRAPWVLHEAFDQSKWHFSASVKALLSGDGVSANIKNGPIVTINFKSPVFWGTNTPPQFKEATKAIVNRMVVIHCTRVFEGGLVGVAYDADQAGYSSISEFLLSRERSGILNWAIEGARRAVLNNKISTTAEMRQTLHDVQMDSNLVAGFMEECVEYDPASKVSTPDFCAAFSVWWSGNRGEGRGVPSNNSIGMAVRNLADRRIGHSTTNSLRYYVGIKLNEAGLDYWMGIASANLAAGKSARLSSTPGDVNKASTT